MTELKFNWILTLAALAVAATACTEELTPGGQEPEIATAESKLIHSSSEAVKGELLVYFDEAAAEEIEGFATKAGGDVLTRSGIVSFDAVLDGIGVKSLTRLFPVAGKNEARTRAAGLHRWYLVDFEEDTNLDEAALAMASVSEVDRVQFNLKMKNYGTDKITPLSEAGRPMATKTSGATQFNDPMLEYQWGYINTGNESIYSGIREGADVRCADAWRLCTGDPRVIVAIIDECVQWDHQDLAPNMWVNEAELNGQDGVDDDGNGYVDDIYGYNFVSNTTNVFSPGESHGTHVAGTVAAVNNNGIGVCGIAGGTGNGDGVRLMTCQVFEGEEESGGSATVMARAIKYAADNGAAIIQCSVGYEAGAITSDDAYANSLSAEKNALDYFLSSQNCDAVDGGIAIYAAGNDGAAMSGYPAAYKDCISVTAMSCDFTPAYYTNYGYGCNIAAPGGDAYQSYLESETTFSEILSTIPDNDYGFAQGTSMACPHVSGVAALGLSYALQTGVSFTRKEFCDMLLSSVYGINSYCTGTKPYFNANGLANLNLSNHRGKMGTGVIDAFRLLMNIKGITCVPVSVGSQTQLNIAPYIGDGNAQYTIDSATISQEDKNSLGITADPRIFGGMILFTCENVGSGILSVTYRAGTNSGNGMYGMTVTKDFAIVARDSHSENGGWL